MTRPPRKNNPAWHDTPEARVERQRRRRARLKAIAQAAGYESWSKLETAVLNGEVAVIATPPQPTATGEE